MKTKTPPAAFGRRLRELRTAAGLTQAELGRLTDLGSQTIPRLERDERQPSLDTAGRLADALGVTVDALRR